MQTLTLVITAIFLSLSLVSSAQAQRAQATNAASDYQLRPDEVPPEFEHREERDLNMTLPGVERATRFYTRGDPEVPTEEHASLLVSIAVSEQMAEAQDEFETAPDGWTTRGFTFEPLGLPLGDQAVLGRATFFADSRHPKEAILVLFRAGRINVAVQWTDDFDLPNLDSALWVAERIAERATDATTR